MYTATDNHVGYLEKDQVRGGDSLEAFEEVLRIAQDQQASLIAICTYKLWFYISIKECLSPLAAF